MHIEKEEQIMKKLFISSPMRGRTDENIRQSIEKMHRIGISDVLCSCSQMPISLSA